MTGLSDVQLQGGVVGACAAAIAYAMARVLDYIYKNRKQHDDIRLAESKQFSAEAEALRHEMRSDLDFYRADNKDLQRRFTEISTKNLKLQSIVQMCIFQLNQHGFNTRDIVEEFNRVNEKLV